MTADLPDRPVTDRPATDGFDSDGFDPGRPGPDRSENEPSEADRSQDDRPQDDRSQDDPLSDERLPGVGAAKMGLRDALRRGGWAICSLAVPLVAMEQLTREATTVLAPDIRDHFGISDALFVAIAGFSGVALTLGGIPLAWLADRVRRTYLVVTSAGLGACALLGAGLAQNTWQLFAAYIFTGIAAAYSSPVFLSMLTDAYPVEGRGRILSLHAIATPLGQAIGPTLAGSLAALAGAGDQAWRWAYIGLAIPYAVLAVSAAIFLKEPARGQSERQMLLGGTKGNTVEPPVGIIQAFRRMMRVKTFLHMCLGIGVLGLALFTLPLQMSLLLGDEYGYDAFTRGLIFSVAQIPVIAAMFIGGHQFDRSYRHNPPRTMHIAGAALLLFGAVIGLGIWAQPVWALIGVYVLGYMCFGIALVAISPLIAAVTPVRLRTQAFAILPVFTFLMGGFFGSVFAGVISDSYGARTAMAAAVPISAVAAGCLFLRGARFLEPDISAATGELVADGRTSP
ncbi:MFS transporter [Streptomyces sp. NPDC047108]|uniref:MFS transporter n=1 Tax=Streptomyces sp. NPDC047108 TaxID=3155025 RepID=UPI0033E85037